MIYDAFQGEGWGKFHDLDKLTTFADYKLPQILRRLGILQYEKSLADRIDNYEELPAGSRPEVEIRAATVWVVEMMKREFSSRFPFVTAAHVDSYLWDAS